VLLLLGLVGYAIHQYVKITGREKHFGRNEMYDELKGMLENFANLDIEATNNFKATILLRDSLAEVVPMTLANRLVSGMTFAIDTRYSHKQIEELMVPYTKVVRNIITAYVHHGFGDDDLVTVCSAMSLTLE